MPYKREIKNNNTQVFINENGSKYLAPLTVGNGRYELYDILSAAGGFGIIYKAKDNRLYGHEVLIKARRYDNEPGLFTYEYDSSREKKIEDIREKVLFEAECLELFKGYKESRMPILNDIVEGFSPSIYGPHTDKDGHEYYIKDEYINYEPYIVMQVVNGTNLGDLMKKGIKNVVLSRYMFYFEWERQVLEYMKELATIFSNFHSLRNKNGESYYYIYQDLKPDNIIVSSGRFITLLDFGGITKVKVKIAKDDTSMMKEYTETGKGSPGLGTFGFQAPEARNSNLLRSLDKRCDIYTLGATMYQLLTGFDFADLLEDEDDDIPLEETLKGICSESSYAVMERCLQRNRDKRYADVLEFRDDIVQKCFIDVKSCIHDCF